MYQNSWLLSVKKISRLDIISKSHTQALRPFAEFMPMPNQNFGGLGRNMKHYHAHHTTNNACSRNHDLYCTLCLSSEKRTFSFVTTATMYTLNSTPFSHPATYLTTLCSQNSTFAINTPIFSFLSSCARETMCMYRKRVRLTQNLK